MVQGDTGRVSWELALTADFLPTIMDVLNVSRPAHQADWGVDGRSMLPLLKAPVSAFDKQDKDVYKDAKNVMPPQPMGWMYNGWEDPQAANASSHAAFRYGQWKYVHRSKSCSNDDCMVPMLFDLSNDISEQHDVSAEFPEIFSAIQHNFSVWYTSVLHSIVNESQCQVLVAEMDSLKPTRATVVLNACCGLAKCLPSVRSTYGVQCRAAIITIYACPYHDHPSLTD